MKYFCHATCGNKNNLCSPTLPVAGIFRNATENNTKEETLCKPYTCEMQVARISIGQGKRS